LLDSEGRAILQKDKTRSHCTPLFLNEALPQILSAQAIRKTPSGKLVYHSMTMLKGYWTCYIPLPHTPFAVVFYCDSFELVRKALRQIMPHMLWQLFFLLVLLAFNHHLMQRFFTRPLGHLMAHLNNERLGLTSSTDHFQATWRVWADFISSVLREKRRGLNDLERRLQETDRQLKETLFSLTITKNQLRLQENRAGFGVWAQGVFHTFKNQLQYTLQSTPQMNGLPDAFLEALISPPNKASPAHCPDLNIWLYTAARFYYEGYFVEKGNASSCHTLHAVGGGRPLMMDIKKAPHPLYVACDTKGLSAVLLNILTRAFDALDTRECQQKAALSSKVPDRHQPQISITLTQQESNAVLVVQDNGQPFLEAGEQPSDRNTLFLSHIFALLNGGSLTIQKTDTDKTQVTLSLPLRTQGEASDSHPI
jgi:signal transduction histidine kinase